MKRTLIKRLDKEIRLKVLERANYHCERCGKEDTLQSAHIYSKGAYPHLRHELDNLLCLCFRCHFYWAHRNPMDFQEWVKGYLSRYRWNKLQRMRRKEL